MKGKINTAQYIFLIHGAQMGVGILSLPRELGELAGPSGFLSIILGWGVASLTSILIIKAMERFPENTAEEIFVLYLGNKLGKMVIFYFACYLVFFSYTLMLSMVMLLKSWILPGTSVSLLLSLLVIPTFIISRGGVKVLGRYAESTFILTFWILFLLYIPLEKGAWLYFLPFFNDGIMPILEGTKLTVFSFLGFEIIFFIYPYLSNKKKAIRGAITANTITLLIYVSTTIACYLFYGPDTIVNYFEPVLTQMSNIRFRYVERLDIILLPMYMFVVSTTWIPYVYFTATCLSQIISVRRCEKIILPVLLSFIIATLILDQDWSMLNTMRTIVTYMGSLIYVFALLLYIYSLFHYHFRKGEKLES
ncbi:GerAB/ArcD/ProY family transporter [Bacillus mesophilum]|uniref:GerAB/ArcD/ProY family transporter n=1 Tax=Bacillus mesophilum TaxID=1071718 RepID=A0A7V7RJ81_9BACI|nr:endospore germination permease [Bacillus mesophilum]KAB2330655.1 GerAB/ArcD/ProY family transporter [Bacillus mesophilum]